MPIQSPIRPAIRPQRLRVDFDSRSRRAGVERPRVRGVEAEQHVDEEEEEEGDAVEDEDVGDVGDVGVGEEGHLFFCGAHEEEAGGVEELEGSSRQRKKEGESCVDEK